MVTKVRDASKDFDTLAAAGNGSPRGIWSDGTTMWVVDDDGNFADKIYAYDLATKSRDTSKDYETLRDTENRDPAGIWSDGTTIWVTDLEHAKIYAYDLATEE